MLAMVPMPNLSSLDVRLFCGWQLNTNRKKHLKCLLVRLLLQEQECVSDSITTASHYILLSPILQPLDPQH